MDVRDRRREMAHSAAAIYAGAMVVGLIETFIPGGPEFSIVPGLTALVMAPLIFVFGPRLPLWTLASLGPIGAALIAFALATTHGFADAAVLYMWPVIWMSYFFGKRGTLFIVAWIGLVHGIALLEMPAGQGNFDRWIDVTSAVAVVALVIRMLAARNEQLVASLVAEARIDPLTGLLNRRGFDERLQVEVSRASRESYPLGVIVFDIDNFKQVNDLHGHEVGDRVLSWLGHRLADQSRGGDVVARIGGEEFVVLLPRSDEVTAREFAERVRQAVESARFDRGEGADAGVPGTITLTVSAGIASSIPQLSAELITSAADRAMFEAKRAGRNRSVTVEIPETSAAAEGAPA